jgi:hypothetical protein
LHHFEISASFYSISDISGISSSGSSGISAISASAAAAAAGFRAGGARGRLSERSAVVDLFHEISGF